MESLAGKKALIVLTNEAYFPKSRKDGHRSGEGKTPPTNEGGPVFTKSPSTWINPTIPLMEPPTTYSSINNTSDNFNRHHQPTGVDVFELCHIWMHLHKQLKMELVFATPRGGPVAADPISVERMEKDSNIRDCVREGDGFIAKMGHTLPINWIKPEEFKLVILLGGHGAMFDLPEHDDVACAISEVYRKNGIIAAIGHGVAGLINARRERRGDYLIKGKKMTCFTKDEERQVGYENYLPFILEERLKERGATIQNKKAFESNVIVEGRIITAQSPPSIKEFVEKIEENMKKL